VNFKVTIISILIVFDIVVGFVIAVKMLLPFSHVC